MPRAWNGWYHLTSSTYGTWHRGDPRGWRTRHHREHVEGDYRNPPAPGTFEETLALSKRLMKRPPVRLSVDQRIVIVSALVEKLSDDGCDPLAVTMTRNHAHVLARFRDHDPREWFGRAKKHASHTLRLAGRTEPGGIWGVRSQVVPITDRAHQINTLSYILAHADEGGATWDFRSHLVRPPRVP